MRKGQPSLSPDVASARKAVRVSLKKLLDEQRKHAHNGQVRIFVGLSGGADSLALADALAFEAPKMAIRVGAIVVDHALQDGSNEVAQKACEQAKQMGLDPVYLEKVKITQSSNGLEADARKARYAAFDRVLQAEGAVRIFVAHTLNDQAETVLLGLARGSGAKSLSGMREDTGKIMRPFLKITAEQTRQVCLVRNLVPWNDPHNMDVKYRRVRVRREVMPMLEDALNPRISHALARTADLLQEDDESLMYLIDCLLDQMIERLSQGECIVEVAQLQQKPDGLVRKVLWRVCQRCFGVNLSREHVLMVSALVTQWHGQGPVFLSSLVVVREAGKLRFTCT